MIRKVFYGDDIVAVNLPDSTRVIEAPDPIPGMADYEGAVRKAINEPVGCEPLMKQVKPDSRITIAFDDPCLPLPPMARDVRGRVIEILLDELFKAGVPKDRIRLVCAVGLHRKWTPGELKHLLGPKVWAEMGPNRIENHDAEDPWGIIHLGKSPGGRVVEVNRLVIESDVLVYVNVNWTSMNGGWKSVIVGLGTFDSIHEHHRSHVLQSGSIMDPANSLYHDMMADMGQVVLKNANIFSIETVINNNMFGPRTRKLLSLDDAKSHKVSTLTKLSRRMPVQAKRLMSSRLRSAYEPIAVNAGRPDKVHPLTLEALHRQQNVAVKGQTDALFLALPNISPYSSFSRINPILAMNMAAGYAFSLYQGKPAVREGGVMIVMNPFLPGFHKRHHPSYKEFFDKVLAETTDPEEAEERFALEFARRPEYIQRYRYHYAYHGVHPFYAWMWGAIAMKKLSRIIVAGAVDEGVVQRLGLESAPTLYRALAMAEDTLGKNFSLTYLAMPPIFCTEVSD